MNVLITGGAGFIGSHIVDLLVEKHYKVSIIDNLSHGKKENINSKAVFYEMDIRNEKILEVFEKEKPKFVIHNAAQISVPNSIVDPVNDASINIMGTINVLEAARKFNVKKIIYPASAAIFGEPSYLPIDEEHPLEMLSGYGVTKHTVEHYLKVYKSLYNIDYVSLRCSNVYGPRQDYSGEGGVIAIFCEKLLNNERPFIYGDGYQIRDFVFVKDVARAYLMAIESEAQGIFNVCTNSKVTVNELLSSINSILHKDIAPIYTDSREGDIRDSYMSYDKINRLLGWKPEKSLIEGLKETLDYYNKYSKSESIV
ncbi:NAD-dependent epimerase/dehydratase family protein [Clostridium pasteurianum]|uniref:Nucleoside-diphosphate-sugar epimerase n=1 Tax=Clostridium pasteurianum BC1 TaxID=86416 RepID=R4KAU6_CLOPA|nr:NAD-dependent epimerase/dehydratase family protein [Clostridium pasteurianum]AGK98816.1 nucleoside-diphosphate-sugar epimerase [Clostridium pasteurianum BC1]